MNFNTLFFFVKRTSAALRFLAGLPSLLPVSLVEELMLPNPDVVPGFPTLVLNHSHTLASAIRLRFVLPTSDGGCPFTENGNNGNCMKAIDMTALLSDLQCGLLI